MKTVHALTSSFLFTMTGFLGLGAGRGLIFISVFGLDFVAGASCSRKKNQTLPTNILKRMTHYVLLITLTTFSGLFNLNLGRTFSFKAGSLQGFL